MDARFINPVIDAFRDILPQLGFADIQWAISGWGPTQWKASA